MTIDTTHYKRALERARQAEAEIERLLAVNADLRNDHRALMADNERMREAILWFVAGPRDCECWPDCRLGDLRDALPASGGATTFSHDDQLEEALDVLRGIALACRVLQSSGKASDLKRALASIGEAAASVFEERPSHE